MFYQLILKNRLNELITALIDTDPLFARCGICVTTILTLKSEIYGQKWSKYDQNFLNDILIKVTDVSLSKRHKPPYDLESGQVLKFG
jgi:hypothetical protein